MMQQGSNSRDGRLPAWRRIFQEIAGRHSLATGVYLAASFGLVWPVVLYLNSQIPMGTESSQTVPLFNLWTLGWNSIWLSNPSAGYWNAPIFYPVADSFAFSDPQSLTGILAASLWGFSPALAYNLMLFSFLVLNGLAVRGFLLARGIGSIAALSGGLLAEALPFFAQERGVLQLQPIFGIVLAVDQLWKLSEQPRFRHGVGLGLAAAVTYHVSQYYALFLFFYVLALVPVLFGRSNSLQTWRALVVAVVLAGFLVLPPAISQRSALQQMGFSRPARTLERFSASGSDYFRRSPALWFSGPAESTRDPANYLWPGFVILGLAILGGVTGFRSPATRRLGFGIALAGGVAFCLSLGPKLSLGSWRPYEIVRVLVPGMENLRSPFRFGVCVQLSLVLMAGLGVQALLRGGRRKLAAILMVVAVLEAVPRPAAMVRVPPLPSLEGLEPPTAFIPFAPGTTARDHFKTTATMCLLLPSRVSMVNGYSGYFPHLNRQLQRMLANFPTGEGLEILRSLGVKTVLVEVRSLQEVQKSRLEELVQTGILDQRGLVLGVSVFGLGRSEFNPISRYSGPWRLTVRILSEVLELQLSAEGLAPTDFYVLSPRSAPLELNIDIRDATGEERVYSRFPTGARLVHADEPSLWVTIPRPSAGGDYEVVVNGGKPGATIGSARVHLPPVR